MKVLARPRRIVLLVGLLVAVPAAALLALALWPLAADGPPPGAVSNTPGDGGLRRPFPRMAIRSGKFRFIDRTTDAQAIEELKTQQDSGLVDKKSAVNFGQQLGAEFLLTANFSEINQRVGNTTDVYYKFTMSLKNLKTGILEWSDEKEIRKVFKRGTFGG